MRFDRNVFTQTRLLSQTINIDHLERAFQLARLDYEAAHQPGTGETNVSGGATSDPTAAAAARPKPNHEKWHNALANYLSAVGTLHEFAKQGISDPDELAQKAKPCRGGHYHQPDDNNRCILGSCRKPWPRCSPDHPAGRFEECEGSVYPSESKCAICELHKNHWVCRSCLEVKGPETPCKADMCRDTCYFKHYRAQKKLADAT